MASFSAISRGCGDLEQYPSRTLGNAAFSASSSFLAIHRLSSSASDPVKPQIS
nr:MAG TPA: hypothetical protein [Caudoviricetes sp.]